MKLEAKKYQHSMTAMDWLKFEPIKNFNTLELEYVSYAIDSYLKDGKPANFDVKKCVVAFIQHTKEKASRDGNKFTTLTVEVGEEKDTTVDNPEIYKDKDLFEESNAIIEGFSIDDAFARLGTINKEIMVKYHVNLIKLIKRCLVFENQYSEEFMLLKEICNDLDEVEREDVMLIISNVRKYEH